MKTEQKKQGRPRGQRWGFTRGTRFDAEGLRLLKGLAEKWQVAEAAAIRRAVLEAAKREKVE